MSIFGAGHEVVTSTTKPSSPSVGQLIYCTDTDEYLKYVVDLDSTSRWMQASLKPNRNVIINGGIKVAQYGTSFSYASGGGTRYYPTDRFNVENYNWSAGSNPTVSNDTTVYPTGGFRNSIKYQVGATGLTFGSGGWQSIMHRVEGYNIAHLYSSTVTLSFWVRSSVTGTYGVGFYNDYWGTGSPTRGYVAEYTIIAANTWEKKTITTSLATATASGTWNSTNGIGLFLEWGLGSHAGRKSSTYTGGWTPFSTYGVQSNNQVQLASTANATFYLAGVQLEVGSAPSEFEFEPFETTLRKCQRYYAASLNSSDTFHNNYVFGFNSSSLYNHVLHVNFPCTMRIVPTLTVTFINQDNAINGGQHVHTNGFTQYYRCSNSAFQYLSWRAYYNATAEL